METLDPTPLNIPLTVIEAKQDMVVTSDQLEGWQAWSCHHIHREAIDADHFSYRKQPRPYWALSSGTCDSTADIARTQPAGTLPGFRPR